MANALSHFQLGQTHACEQGQMCVSEQPGHALSLIQLRVASATPSKWNDTIVRHVGADGELILAPVFGGDDVTVWHHASMRSTLSIGDPVALHSLYGVLAFGSNRLSVVVA